MEPVARMPQQHASSSKPMRQSKLYIITSSHEPACDLEERLEHAMNILLSNLKTEVTSDPICHKKIQDLAETLYEDVSLGLLYLILTSPANVASVCWSHLSVIAREGLKNCVVLVCTLVHSERFARLREGPLTQILWLLKELIRCDLAVSDLLIWLMRQIPSADFGSRSLWLAENIVDTLQENLTWVRRTPGQIGHIVYNYLRLLGDHVGTQHERLFRKELDLVSVLLNEHFTECLPIGRDLGRLMLMVARVPEIGAIWQTLLTNPQKLSQQLTDPLQLFSVRTSRRYLLDRVTPDMERKFHTLLNGVKFANRKKFQEVLTKQFLSTPANDSLRADLVRFICGVIHPSNEILASDVTPRWSVIGWLLTGCQEPMAKMAIKLALFWDWFFYDPAPQRDNIMNIEPAILLIHNHVNHQSQLARSLLDYLVRSMVELGPTPAFRDKVKQGVKASLGTILEKRVVTSLTPIFDAVKGDRDLRVLVTTNLPEFFSPGAGAGPVATGPHAPLIPPPPPVSSLPVINIEAPPQPESSNNNNGDVLVIEETTGGAPASRKRKSPDPDVLFDAEFSSEEEEAEIGGPNQAVDSSKAARLSETPHAETNHKTPGPSGAAGARKKRPDTAAVARDILSPNLKVCIEDCKRVKDDFAKCGNAVQKLLLAILSIQDFGDQESEALAEHLKEILAPQFEAIIFPEDYTDQAKLEDSISGPLSVIFRNLCLTPEDDRSTRTPLLMLLASVRAQEPRIGYRLLYFLKVSGNLANGNGKIYKALCRTAGLDLEACLVEDLSLAAVDDFRLFGYLIPDIFERFEGVALASVELMRLVVGNIDSVQLHDLISRIILHSMDMFGKESFIQLLTASIEWETIEQYFLWQLIAANDVPFDWVYPVIPKLEYPRHSEAMSNILLYIRKTEMPPCAPLLRAVLSRTCDPGRTSRLDVFTPSVLALLIEVDEEKLMEIVSSLLAKSATSEAAKGSGSGSAAAKKAGARGIPLACILGHLDSFRQHYKHAQSMFEKPNLESALRDAQKCCTEPLRARFGELFSVMEALNSVRGGRALRRGRNAGSSGAAKPPDKDLKSEDEKSEGEYNSDGEEETSRRSSSRTSAKKRPRYVESDSD